MMIAAMIPEKSANQAAGDGVARFRDAYAAEVHGKDVERGIRGAACHAAHAADERVGDRIASWCQSSVRWHRCRSATSSRQWAAHLQNSVSAPDSPTT